MGENNPKLVLLFCGKRKSGKDYMTDWLLDCLKKSGKSSVILKLSGPLKHCYAKAHNLNFEELMSDGAYKEQYRSDMVAWSSELRNRDPGYFCRQAEEMYNGKDHEIWIVSDCRRKSDFCYFESNYSGRTKRIRIFASEETRAKRGFVFESGIDDAETECGLDDQDNDFLLENSDESHPENVLQDLLQYLSNLGFVL